MNLRARLLGGVAGLSVLTLGGAFVVVNLAVNRDQERQLDHALVLEAYEEAREIAQLGGDRLAISARPGPMANDVGPLTKYAVIYGADGAIRAATETFRGRPPAFARVSSGRERARPFDLDGPGEHLRGVLVPVPGRVGVELLLAAPRTDLDGDAVFLRRAMVLVFAVAVGWSLLIAYWFGRRIAQDYELLASVARRVAGGDLSARVASRSADPELRRLGRDLDDMILRLGDLVTAQQRFIANAAHELRSPLTALLGEITLTLRKERDAQSYREALEAALESTEQLHALADNLLTLARVGADAAPRDEPVDLAELVREEAAELAVQAEARGVRVAVEFRDEAGPAVVRGRAVDLRRMLRNLLENAVRHALTTVFVRCALAAGEVEVRVEDDGAGVDDADRERIFDPFYRGAASRGDALGAGLGLAIAREIARAHGGELRLDEGSRTRFVARVRVH